MSDPTQRLAQDLTLIPPGSIIRRDPRRLGRRPMLHVWCWCGRFYTLTPEAAARAFQDNEPPCPEACGGGVE